jgi:adenine-specific DNA-methyltransferase
MFAMSYTSQGTGHYAQYRDAKTFSSMTDILIYRRRSFVDYFIRKYNELLAYTPAKMPDKRHLATSLDFRDCLDVFEGGLVYADPPYCFVHYSRFYHALETLVLYDYPELQKINGTVVKGRYRENRHQSPFCIKSKVSAAFSDLFDGVRKTSSNLVMSYSNTGMISIDEIESLALTHFPNSKLELVTTNHQHMTLGRQKDRHRDVKECLLIVKS